MSVAPRLRDVLVELCSFEPLCGSCRKARLYRQAEQKRWSSVEGQQERVGGDGGVDKGDKDKDREDKDNDSKGEDENKNEDVEGAEERTIE